MNTAIKITELCECTTKTDVIMYKNVYTGVAYVLCESCLGIKAKTTNHNHTSYINE